MGFISGEVEASSGERPDTSLKLTEHTELTEYVAIDDS